MGIRSGLKRNVTAESPAYGYTLAIWGSGALFMSEFATGGLGIMSFVLGGVIGFGTLSALAFGSLMKKYKGDRSNEMLVVSMIHVLASFGAVAINFLLIGYLSTISIEFAGFTMGFIATTGYNALLMVEHYLYKDLYELESQNHEESAEPEQ